MFRDDIVITSQMGIQKIISFYWLWIIAIFASTFVSVVVSEDFIACESAGLTNIQFYTIIWNKIFTDNQTLEIVGKDKDTQKSLYSEVVKMSLFKDAKSYMHTILTPKILEEGKWYTIEFNATTSEGQEYMAMMMTKSTNNEDGVAYINGEPTDEHISMKLWTRG